MKTFDKKDLITWSNRHNAKINSKGYFANCIYDLKDDIEHNKLRTLVDISDDYDRCFDCYSSNNSDVFSYGFFLPKEAVKENKTYRPCKNLRELYLLIHDEEVEAADLLYKEEFIYDIIGKVIHFKWKSSDTTHYECITGIAVYNNGDIAVQINGSQFELDELFKSYEIEINGEWKPFGVLEK